MKKKLIVIFSFLFVFLLAFSSLTLAYHSTQYGEINIQRGYIETVGKAVAPDNVSTQAQAKLLAREGAILMGRTRMLELLEGVKIDAKTTMVNMMANQKVNQEVSGVVQGAHIVEGSENWDGEIYTIRLRKPIKEVYKIVYQERKERFTKRPPKRKTEYTGLVIDAREVDLTPQVMFEILNEYGNVVYSAAKAHYQPAVDRGLTGFASSIETAKEDSRTGSNPLVVEAIDTEGTANTNVVVSRQDGERIKYHLDETEVFRNVRVIIVTG